MMDRQHLIIGGTTKAATTSVFNYLASHPQVCEATLKETGFFFDNRYPLPVKYRFEDGLEKYNSFFGHCEEEKIRLEATPEYLYSSGTPWKIKNSLPNVKLVFILREPLSRLLSWYKYAKQIGKLSPKTPFEMYVREQLRAYEKGLRLHPYMHAMEQGRYSDYLRPFFELFGRELILVLWYEDLKDAPVNTMRKICSFADIEPSFYDDYDFKIYNRTHTMRSPFINHLYRNFRLRVRYLFSNNVRLRSMLRTARLALEPYYLKLNTRPTEENMITPEIKAIIDDYYENEASALAELTGSPPPWPERGLNL